MILGFGFAMSPVGLPDTRLVRALERRRFLKGQSCRPFYGGPKEDRTPDLCIANAALSQLSYRPSRTSVALAGVLAFP